MSTGDITSYIDVAQLALYVFWLFFFGLVFYIRREDKREGYPLVADPQVPSEQGKTRMQGFPAMPEPKVFRLADGSTRQAPREESDPAVKATPSRRWPGAPLIPDGDPMVDGVGPASYVQRPDVAEKTMHGAVRMVPMRLAKDFSIAAQDRDPRGMPVVGADGLSAGTVSDVWIDLADSLIRFLEVELPGKKTKAPPAEGEEGKPAAPATRKVLLPMTLSRIDGYRGKVRVKSITSEQFAGVPTTKNPDQITQLEEDKISAYYGGGTLYATKGRQEPWL